MANELRTLSWAEIAIYWDCLETMGDFPEQSIHDDIYKFLTQIVDDILYDNKREM